MASLVERLRVRTERKPLYNDDDLDDEIFATEKGGFVKEGKSSEKIVREDAKADTCQACGESENLIECVTCTYSFHVRCLLIPKVASEDNWSCPECVNPLNEIEKILDCEICPTDETADSKPSSKQKSNKQYLVKWKGLSYLHCSWVPEKEFQKAYRIYPRLRNKVNNFQKQMESLNGCEDDYVAIRPEWVSVDRIIASRKKGDNREYLVKWKELPYDECSWEAQSDISSFESEIERFNMIQSRGRRKHYKKELNKEQKKELKDSQHKLKDFQQYEHSPEFLLGKLHPYQLEGLNFLRYSWNKGTHVILADEMGLGKTIQSIAFLASLFEENLSPHLVIAPLSTLRNWEREFATWAPQLNVVMYFGSAQARAIIRQYEFFYPKVQGKPKKDKKPKSGKDADAKKQERIKFDVLLTSYEMINMDATTLKSIHWESMIVDEGHRLKNKESKLFLQLKLFATKHRVLLTGTPLQNNLDELFMLMHFLDTGKFASIEDFQKEFKDINQEEQIARLHKMLAPHLLRRVKKDVMKDLPPKKELILRVDLSNRQKDYYKAILTRNYSVLARRSGPQISLNNVVMELRKLCCHVYMLEGEEPQEEPSDANEGLRRLLESSGKMQLLDKMMVKLKEQGHRVLIYSQFQHMLDLLEDYLTYRKWSYERIDGKIGGAERQVRIDRFNAKNSTRFCFLLSTRAGGLGINLATADTVIIYDSDWNPHADLQAMARAHRLGQTNKVMIYRLITRGTIEERMMQMTKKKMILEHLVVGRLKQQQSVNQEYLDDIIRYGSKELFADENDEASKARQIHYDDAAVDRLLNREQVEAEESSIDDEDDDLLKAFKVANFEYIDEVEAAAAKEEEARKQAAKNAVSNANADRADYWDELLRDRFEVQRVDEFTAMGKGKRSRRQMTATEEDDMHDENSEDDDYSYEDDLSDVDIIPGNAAGRRPYVSRKKSRDFAEPHLLMDGEGKSFRVLGFNQYQRAAFLQILMRFGFRDYDWKEFVPRIKGKSWQEIHDYGAVFMQHVIEPITDLPNFSDGVPKEGLRVEDVLVRIGTFRTIEEKVLSAKECPGTAFFPDDIVSCFPALNAKIWKGEHDLLLLKAILKHGYARWQAIVEDKDIGLADIVRQELNLPSMNGASSGSDPLTDAANSQQPVNCREIQRRMVEFIRKRYLLVEKAMNMEIFLDKCGNARPSETANGDCQVEINGPEARSHGMLASHLLLRELPVLDSIGQSEFASIDHSARLEMRSLYNGMCQVAADSALDSVQAYLGDSLAASRVLKSFQLFETICNNVQRILEVSPQSDRRSNSPPLTESNINNAGDASTKFTDDASMLGSSNGANPASGDLSPMNKNPDLISKEVEDVQMVDTIADKSADGVVI